MKLSILALVIVVTLIVAQPQAIMARKASGEQPLLLDHATGSSASLVVSAAKSANTEGVSGFDEHPVLTSSAHIVKAFEGIVTVTSSRPECINNPVVKN